MSEDVPESQPSPVPSTTFMTPFDLTREEEADLHDSARSKASALLAATSNPPGPEWTRTKSLGPSILESTSPTQTSVRATALIRGSPELVLQVLDSAVVSSYRNAMRLVYQHAFADTAVLYHHQMNSHESLAVQWTAFRCHNPLLTDIDMCCVEYTNIPLFPPTSPKQSRRSTNQEDSDPNDDECLGQTCIGYKLCESITRKQCPSLQDSHCLERVSSPLWGYALYPSNNGIQVVFTMSLSHDSSSPRRLANRRLLLFLAAALPRLQQAVDVVQHQQHQHPPHTSTNTYDNNALEASSSSITCGLCARLFSHRRRRHPCRACSQDVCHICSSFHGVAVPGVGLARVRVCTKCRPLPVETPAAPAIPPPRLRAVPTNQTTPISSTPTPTSAPAPPPIAIRSRMQLDLDMVHTPAPRASPGKWAPRSPLVPPRSTGTSKAGFHGFSVRHPSTSPVPSPGKPPHSTDSPQRKLSVPTTTTLLGLLEQATAAMQCKFAGLSMVKTPSDPVLQHFLHVQNSAKMLVVPSQMAICAPVLACDQSLVVGHTHLESTPQVDWLKLPIVMGPQKATFYAGVPLRSSTGQSLGALCVFDCTARDVDAIPPEALKTLDVVADTIVALVEGKQRVGLDRRRSRVSDDGEGREEGQHESPASSPARKPSLQQRGGYLSPSMPLTNQDAVSV
ncbi:hypothetical protein DYB25_004689 [Aphanomyces astaci]|uniref:FYVE-type domain-containing protein n=1 Tax=Aphanomyces astaci TaxID=112090 RepID=A0A397B172_APHAT|nr:hypothetical protein DYB25_004689 [Aphanomyces astaci]